MGENISGHTSTNTQTLKHTNIQCGGEGQGTCLLRDPRLTTPGQWLTQSR